MYCLWLDWGETRDTEKGSKTVCAQKNSFSRTVFRSLRSKWLSRCAQTGFATPGTLQALPTGACHHSWFSVALRPQRPYGLLVTGSPGRLPRLSHSSWAPTYLKVRCCFPPTETTRTFTDGEPRTATSTFTQLLSSDLPPSSMLLSVHRDRKDFYN